MTHRQDRKIVAATIASPEQGIRPAGVPPRPTPSRRTPPGEARTTTSTMSRTSGGEMLTIDLTDAVEAAARAQYERAMGLHPASRTWAQCTEHERTAYRTAVRPHIEAAAPVIAARSLQDAAAAFRTTRPTDRAARAVDYPAVELQAMAYRHTIAAERPAPAPAPSAITSRKLSQETAPVGVRNRALHALRLWQTTQVA
jgi:alpha-beta hydrolase superfamily lysophospholipase